MDQDVIGLIAGGAQVLKGRLQTGEIVIGQGADLIQLHGFDIPFNDVLNIFAIDLSGQNISVGVLGAAQTDLDVGEEPVRTDEILLGIHNGEQHVEGSIGFHIELAGSQIDVNTVVQTDADDLVLRVPLEGVVAHRHGGVALFNAADVVESIHPEHRAIGELVAVKAGGGIIAAQVAVQHFNAGDFAVCRERNRYSLIAQGSWYGHGDHQGIGIHGDIPDSIQLQVYVAICGANLFHLNRCGRCGAVAASRCLILVVLGGNDSGNHVQEDIPLRCGSDDSRVLIIAGHPHIHRTVGCADAGGVEDAKHIRPNGSVFLAGIDVGHLFNRGQHTAGFAGPFDRNFTVVQRQEVSNVDIARAAGGNGKGGGAIAGSFVIHTVGRTVQNNTGVNVTTVGSIEFRHVQPQIRTIGDGCAGNAALVVNIDRSQVS